MRRGFTDNLSLFLRCIMSGCKSFTASLCHFHDATIVIVSTRADGWSPSDLQATLDVLSNLLGPPFNPSQPLQPIASSSNPVLPVPPPSSRSSLTRTGDIIPGYRRSASGGTLAQAIQEGKKMVWMNVEESVVEALEMAVKKAMEERVTLLSHGEIIRC